jgi:4-amino-4-deoxy-L-arabinose transferase-like glycosyltransferase
MIGLDDMFQYDMLARSIASGHGYRWYAENDLDRIQSYVRIQLPEDYDPRGVLTSHRAPAYPALLSLVYAAFSLGPRRIFAARVVQAFVGAFLAPLTWVLGRQVGLGRRAARGAALAIAAYPFLVAYPLALVSENLFMPLLTLALVLTLRARARANAASSLLAGLVFGLASLTRSVVSGFVIVSAGWIWWGAENKRAGLVSSGAMVLSWMLVIAPWVARNWLVYGQPTWIETSLGYNLYLGYHPQSTGTFQYGISLDLLPVVDDAERSTLGMSAFRRFVSLYPSRVPYLMVRKAGYLWGLDTRLLVYYYSNNLVGLWPGWALGLVLLAACMPWVFVSLAAGMGSAWGPMRPRKALVVLLVLYYTAIHMLIMAESRFHMPLLPVLAVLAALALDGHGWRRSAVWQRALGLCVVGLLLANWTLALVQERTMFVELFGPYGNRLYLPY